MPDARKYDDSVNRLGYDTHTLRPPHPAVFEQLTLIHRRAGFVVRAEVQSRQVRIPDCTADHQASGLSRGRLVDCEAGSVLSCLLCHCGFAFAGVLPMFPPVQCAVRGLSLTMRNPPPACSASHLPVPSTRVQVEMLAGLRSRNVYLAFDRRGGGTRTRHASLHRQPCCITQAAIVCIPLNWCSSSLRVAFFPRPRAERSPRPMYCTVVTAVWAPRPRLPRLSGLPDRGYHAVLRARALRFSRCL